MLKQLQTKMFHFIRQRISTQSKLAWGRRQEVREVSRVVQYQVREGETPTLEDIPLDYS